VSTARAPAKLNLSLRVGRVDERGMHPIRSLVTTIGWWDVLTMEESDEDRLRIAGAELPEDGENLVWRAIEALRGSAARTPPVSVELTKRIPVAAGLGGGSADAAAALLLYGELAGRPADGLAGVAASVGADVPYLLEGGLRHIEGYGERLSSSVGAADDFWVVVAVPPFELSTPAVYRAWDRLDEPEGPAMHRRFVPPSLRSDEPLVNDLYPAAVAVNGLVDDWRRDLAARWDREVALSGSGPSLFGFFADEREAGEGLALVPADARAAFRAAPVEHGAVIDDR
jgi:4-diphosphocytidyl-2-C-methyl-D-erythritol kinase